MRKFKGVKHDYELRFNEDLKVYEVVELSTGNVKGNSSDRLHASSLYYEFDGIYESVPVQLSLF